MSAPAADIVIVGGGSAGCILAVRLSEDPVTIERAGGDRFTHWTVLRYLLIPYTNAGVAEGIYST